MKTTTTKTGSDGEKLAGNYLQQKGYELLCFNWRSGKTEVDIIARNGNELVFVEVKTRSSLLTIPEKAVNHKKQALLFRAASAYCEQFAVTREIRFDVVAITKKGEEIIDITHIENAFFPFDGEFSFNLSI